MRAIDWPARGNVFTQDEALTLQSAYRMALHLVADRPAFFSGLDPDRIRSTLARRILSDASAGQSDPVKLSTAAVRGVEKTIRNLPPAAS